MDNRKETVILFRGQIESLLSLSSLKDVKTILRAIVLYGMDNETPEIPEHLTFGWLWFKNTIDSNREQYEAKCDRNRSNAQKRWGKSLSPMRSDANGCERMPTDANDANNDNDNDNDLNEECMSPRTYALDAERIISLYPKAKVGDWKQAILSVSAAIQREIDRGMSPDSAVGIVELGTIAYADAVKKWTHKQFISQAVKFYTEGMYNYDAATWERENKPPQANSRKSGGYDWRNPDTWGEE